MISEAKLESIVRSLAVLAASSDPSLQLFALNVYSAEAARLEMARRLVKPASWLDKLFREAEELVAVMGRGIAIVAMLDDYAQLAIIAGKEAKKELRENWLE